MTSPQPVLGKYQLIRKLAAGGMAEVYLARAAGPMGFEKQVVVKRILPHLADEENFISMFLSEARLAAQLNHPNIVQVFDFGQADATFYLVMEFIDGVNLRALFRKAFEANEPLSFGVAAKIVSLACEGLGFAHDFLDPATGQPMNLVHRDVSPDNILVARNGSVKVVDFGIAKAANQTHLTRTGTVKGKFAYMPPEQLTAQALDKRADIFALGVVLHELVTGKKPFDTSNEAAIVRGIMYEAPIRAATVRPDMPEALQAIIDKALAKDRDQRYLDCRELQADLEKFIVTSGAPVSQYQLAQVVQKLAPPPPQPVPTPTAPNGPPMGVPPTAATVKGEDVDLSTSVLATPPPSEEIVMLTPKPHRAPQPPPPPVPTGVVGAPPMPSPTLPGGPHFSPPAPQQQGYAQAPQPQPYSSSPSGPYPWPSGPHPAPQAQPPPPQWGAQTQGWQVGPPGQAWAGQPAPGWGPPPQPQPSWPQPQQPNAGFGGLPLHGGPAPARPAPPPSSSRGPIIGVLVAAIVVGSGATWFVLKGRQSSPVNPVVVVTPPEPAPVVATPPPAEPPKADPPQAEPPRSEPVEPPPPTPGEPVAVKPAEPPPPEPVAAKPEVRQPEPVKPKGKKLPAGKKVAAVAPEPEPAPPPKPTVVVMKQPEEAPKPAAAEVASVEFRVRPFGAVWVDGKFLGETPFAPASMTVGNHQVRIVNRDLGKEVTKSFDVKSGTNVFRFSFED
ncbi:MAG: serine/threonine-protein kinase [Myxococcota bacterium]